MARRRLDFPIQAYKGGWLAVSNFVQQLFSLMFDDAYSLLSTESEVGITDTFSISVWAKNTEDTPTDRDSLVCIRTTTTSVNAIDLMMALNTNTNLQVSIVNGAVSQRQNKIWANVVDAEWHHYVVTWDGTADGLLMYIDGVETAPTTVSTSLDGTGMTDTARRIILGARVGAGDRWTGPIYSAGIWDKVLTEAEAIALYNGGNGVSVNPLADFGNYASAANLIHYYRLGFGSSDEEFGVDYGVGTAKDLTASVSLDETDLVADVPT